MTTTWLNCVPYIIRILHIIEAQLICNYVYIVYALMYFRAKCLLKVMFLFIPVWKIVVMRKKRDCIFF